MNELTNRLDIRINVVRPRTDIRLLVMRDIINPMFPHKVGVDLPRRVLDHLVDPLAVPHALVPLCRREDRCSLVRPHELVGADADHEVHRGEGELALAQLEQDRKSVV